MPIFRGLGKSIAKTHFLYGYARVAELADALDLGSSGRPWGFKSLRAHHVGARSALLRFFYTKHQSSAFLLLLFPTKPRSFVGAPKDRVSVRCFFVCARRDLNPHEKG